VVEQETGRHTSNPEAEQRGVGGAVVETGAVERWSQPAAVMLLVPLRITELGGMPLVAASKASWV
jgi:hypothetical protein